MKKVKDIVVAITAVTTFSVVSLGINACSQQSPLGAEHTKGQFTILQIGDDNVLNKLASTSKWITYENGGVITLAYDGYESNSGEVSIALSLEVFAETISQDTLITLAMETSSLDMVFGPHGTLFSTPAVLNLEAHGVDFNGVDPNRVDFYYENPETGQWQAMPRDAISVNANDGTVKLINGRLPHFSRYAIGAE